MNKTSCLAMVTVVAAAALAGCSGKENVSYSAISKHPTPELRTTSERPIDVDRNLAYYKNANWRMFQDDLGKAFLTDRPSSLSGYPILSTSGNPR